MDDRNGIIVAISTSNDALPGTNLKAGVDVNGK